ncbi:MAG TPA: DNA translocase FtsK 4TM domain-containing protein, partial [Gammaproteobacteria bacterium]|nr:DNA translocase FtsK 4TM domain-containing protein [Gammaproteobacteria bacterium]
MTRTSEQFRARAPAASPPTQTAIVKALRESAFWVLAGLSLILLWALLSYSPSDPGFSVVGDGDAVSNRMGPAGAWFADVAFLFFGVSAYLFPLLVLLAGLHLFRARAGAGSSWALLYKACGVLLTIATSSGLATLHFSMQELRETAGGVLGQIVGTGLASVLGALGATVLLLVLWLGAVSLATGVSWLAIMDGTGRLVCAAVAEVGAWAVRLRAWAQGRRDARRRERERHKKAAAQARARPTLAPPLRIEPPRIEPVIEKIEKVEASARAERERQVPLFEPVAANELPPLSLLDDPPRQEGGYSAEALEAMSRLVEIKLADFGITVEVVAVQPGPVVTRFELKPAAGVKVSQISNLAKDLARSLATVSVRVVEIIPGKPYVGLEIPNEVRELVALGEMVKSQAYDELKSPLTLALGKDIGGAPVCA